MTPPNGNYKISHHKSHLPLTEEYSGGAKPVFTYIFTIDIDSPEIREFADGLGDSAHLQFHEHQCNDAESRPLFHVHYGGEDLVLTITKLEDYADDGASTISRHSEDNEDDVPELAHSLRLLFGDQNPEADNPDSAIRSLFDKQHILSRFDQYAPQIRLRARTLVDRGFVMEDSRLWLAFGIMLLCIVALFKKLCDWYMGH